MKNTDTKINTERKDGALVQKPKIFFYGGIGRVTGANFVYETLSGKKIMVDCGMLQGKAEDMKLNYKKFEYEPSEIDVLIVTHAHADHIGRIPRLVHQGFKGDIISTPATRDLSEIMFEDSVGLLAQYAEKNLTQPLYKKRDVVRTMNLWKTYEYEEIFTLFDVSCAFYDAGHILGSAMVHMTDNNGLRTLFTGDLGNSPSPLLCDAVEPPESDYVVMESVYGDRNHEGRDQRREQLRAIIQNTIDREGVVIVPVFAIERTQEILYELNNMIEDNELSNVPVFLDAPLGSRVTEIYRNYPHLFKKEVQNDLLSGDDIFMFKGLKITETREQSKAINNVEGVKIILAGSGMSSGGRILHHEMKYLGDPKNTILFVGFQSVGTVGRIIASGAKKVFIHGKEISIRAHVEKISGYSGHMQRDDLVNFVDSFEKPPKKTWCVMGEFGASTFLAQRLRARVETIAIVPTVNSVVELD